MAEIKGINHFRTYYYWKIVSSAPPLSICFLERNALKPFIFLYYFLRVFGLARSERISAAGHSRVDPVLQCIPELFALDGLSQRAQRRLEVRH